MAGCRHFLGLATQFGDDRVDTSRHLVAASYADAWRAWVQLCEWQEWTAVAVAEHPRAC